MAFIVDKLLEYVVSKPLGVVCKVGLKGATKIGQAALRGIKKEGKAVLGKRQSFIDAFKREARYIEALGEDIREILAHNPIIKTRKVSTEEFMREEMLKQGLSEEEIEKRLSRVREGIQRTKESINKKYDGMIDKVKNSKYTPEDRKEELIKRYEAARQRDLANAGYTRLIEVNNQGLQEIGAFNFLFLGGVGAGIAAGTLTGEQKAAFHNVVPTTQLYGSLSQYEIPENIIVPKQIEDAMENYSKSLATGELVFALHDIARGGGR